MVQFVIEGPEPSDQASALLGFPSFYFDLGAQVVDVSSTGFTIVAAPRIPERPGLPEIPGLPGFEFEDEAPDVYSGTGLTYAEVTINGHTMLTPISGTITGVIEEGPDFTTTGADFELDARDFYDVTVTPDNEDNHALLVELHSGPDLIRGGSVRDKLDGFGGDDKVVGGRGVDRLWGSEGDDTLIGGGGKDKLDGGEGDDVLKGGGGIDTFVFTGGAAGKDKIKDFRPDAEHIQIDHEGIERFADLKVKYRGDNAIVRYDDTKIIVQDVGDGALDRDDFLF